jgi:hypothetical protein
MELTRKAEKLSKGMESVLCMSWTRLGQETSPSAEREQAFVEFKELLDCK